MPKREEYLKCDECSKDAKDEVFYHRFTLQRTNDFFEGEVIRCPRGHVLKVE